VPLKMTTVLIRTNAGQFTGIGHLVRCLQLAKKLHQKKVQVIFVLDYIETKINAFLIEAEVRTFALYSKPQAKINQIEDANRVKTLIKTHKPNIIIVDDYRLAKVWETIVYDKRHTLVVIDDILRSHQCDVLIDMKWRGELTKHSYDQLVPEDTHKLLGPDYVLLADHYETVTTGVNEPTDSFNIMVGLGGGGDFSQCQQIIDSLLQKQYLLSKSIKITAVLGPLAINRQVFINHYQNCDNVEILEGKTDLFTYLKNTQLYIGAAGGILYQLLALQIPALTFAVADNQKSEKKQLEEIGHFFHLENFSTSDIAQVPAFVEAVINNFPRFKTLISQAKQPIDGKGTSRITQLLLSCLPLANSYLKGKKLVHEGLLPKCLSQEKRVQKKDCNEVNSKTFEPITLAENYQLGAVGDQHINHYLISRNLPSNCKNMIQAEKIPLLSHYSWWFNAQRESYLLTNKHSPCLYIWHEQRSYQEQRFLIGGWFICQEHISFQEALLALNWQLSYCQKAFPNIPWIAVIHRENKFVKLLNKYLGFEDIGADHAYKPAIKALFNGASFDDFDYVTFNGANDLDSQSH